MFIRRFVVLSVMAAVLAVPAVASADPPGDPMTAIQTRGDRYKAEPPGTISKYTFWFGPYLVPAGSDLNRPDLELPMTDGTIISVEPKMRRVADLTVPAHQEAHIHHAHWFALDPGNEEDNYTGGNTEWIFGNGDEETKADFTERSAAEPNGPVYGQYIPAATPQLMIYMLHNKTSQLLNVYITLEVTFLHGTPEAASKALGRPVHNVVGALWGRTYSVPRQPLGDGIFTSNEEKRGPIEWTSTVDGTIIGTGSHLHPGGLSVITENLGSKERPCARTGEAQEGTHLLTSSALFKNNVLFSEDFQMEVSHPAWRAPIRRGDRIRITGIYGNKDNAWYDVMTHQGIYIDPAQPPKEGCKPYLVGGLQERTVTYKKVKRKKVVRVKVRSKKASRRGKATRYKRVVKTYWVKKKIVSGIDVTDGVMNRPWHPHDDAVCGVKGAPACDRPEAKRPPGKLTSDVTIANFLYQPGDMSLSGEDGAPPRIKQGTSLRFTNIDQYALIRHSVTTCAWPCNGRYVANYPFPDGLWDSGTLGYDPIDGGSTSPFASTPSDLAVGKYAYFCRIHPWMRGAFEVVS